MAILPSLRLMPTLVLAEPTLVEDGHFLERVQAGDLEAIAEIYDRHHRALCTFASRLLGDDAAAEDLVHDVFVVLPKLVHKYSPDCSLRAFLLGIAANRARHHVRAAARRRKLAERFSQEPPPALQTPEQHVQRRRLADRLARALDRLSFEQRTAFVLCEIEGQSRREAAEILSVPEATVRTRLFHARKKLQSFLGKERLP